MRMLCLVGVVAGALYLPACARDALPEYDASIGDGTMNGGTNTGMSSGGTDSGSSTNNGGVGSSGTSGGSSGSSASTGGMSSGSSSGSSTGDEDAAMPCPDRDADTVCDTADNCPDKANTDQKDMDADGAGDACDAACVADAVPASIDTARVTLSNIKLNGSGQVIDVMAGGSLQIDVDYDMAPCMFGSGEPISLRHQLLVGFDDGSTPVCAVDNLCAPLTGAAQKAITVPTTPGTYYLLYDVAQEQRCAGLWSAGMPDMAHRIAAICVR